MFGGERPGKYLKKVNRFENLEKMTIAAHAEYHAKPLAKTPLACGRCGKEFERNTTDVRKARKRGQTIFFCTISCGAKFQFNSPREERVILPTFICGWCEKTLEKRKKGNIRPGQEKLFCSSSCGAKYQHALKPLTHSAWGYQRGCRCTICVAAMGIDREKTRRKANR